MIPGTPPVYFGSDRRYRCVSKLAVGGMAELFVALATREAGFEKYVVVKRVLPHLARSPEFVAMFLDEARLSASLDHPNIAQVMDFGKDGDSYYYVMEYIRGFDVRALLRRAKGPLPLPVALSIIVAAASGLHHAHESTTPSGQAVGLVHRDVSPSNLFVSVGGGVKVLDFGIAKAATAAVVTASGVLKGKLGYMSPEQCTGAPLDRRSDVYGLGVVLYELVTGRRPFEVKNYFAALTAAQKGRFVRPSKLCPDLPEQLESVILAAMEREAEDRPPTAAAFAELVEEFAVARGLLLSDRVLRKYMEPLREESPIPQRPTSASVQTLTASRADGIGAAAKLPTHATLAPVVGTEPPTRPNRYRRSLVLSLALVIPLFGAGGWQVHSSAGAKVEPVRLKVGIGPAVAISRVPDLAVDPVDPAPGLRDAHDISADEAAATTLSTEASPPPAPTRRHKKRSTSRRKNARSTAHGNAKDRLGTLAPPS